MRKAGDRLAHWGLPASALAGLVSAGCAAGIGGPGSFASVAAYQRSNAFAPAGFSEEIVGETHFKVAAGGTEWTPAARVEKIALARAAEIGVERRLGYFKILSVTHGAACSKKREIYRGTVPATRAPTVVLDVVYAKAPPPGDSDYKNAKDTFASVIADLSAETFSAEATAAAAAELSAKCGGLTRAPPPPAHLTR